MLSNDNLMKLVSNFISTDDIYDKCMNCGQPSLLHKEGDCTRMVEETADVVNKIWTHFRT